MIEPGYIAVMVTVILAFLAAGMYVIRAEVRKGNDTATASHDEVTQNHGSSLRDVVDRVESRLNDVHIDVREIRRNQSEHLSWHLGTGRDGN